MCSHCSLERKTLNQGSPEKSKKDKKSEKHDKALVRSSLGLHGLGHACIKRLTFDDVFCCSRRSQKAKRGNTRTTEKTCLVAR